MRLEPTDSQKKTLDPVDGGELELTIPLPKKTDYSDAPANMLTPDFWTESKAVTSLRPPDIPTHDEYLENVSKQREAYEAEYAKLELMREQELSAHIGNKWYDPALTSARAGLELHNPISAWMYGPGSKPDFPPVAGYDPYDPDQEDLTGYDPAYFTTSFSPAESAWIKERITYETKLRELAGWQGEIFGVITRPEIWLVGALTGGAGALATGGVRGAAAARNLAAARVMAGSGATTPAALLAGPTLAARISAADRSMAAVTMAGRPWGLGRTVGAEVAVETGAELVLQNEQITRTMTESAINIAGTGLATAALGGLVRLIPPSELDMISKGATRHLQGIMENSPDARKAQGDKIVLGIQRVIGNEAQFEYWLNNNLNMTVDQLRMQLREPETAMFLAAFQNSPQTMVELLRPFLSATDFDELEEVAFREVAGPRAVGAQQFGSGEVAAPGFERLFNLVPFVSPERAKELSTSVARALIKVASMGPGARMAVTRSAKARETYRRLAMSPFSFDDEAGYVPVEAARRQFTGMYLQGRAFRMEQYTAYRKRVGAGALSEEEFGEQIAYAARRGDVHEIPEVQAAAQFERKNLNALRDRGLEAGSFGDVADDIKVKYAQSYFPRVFNTSDPLLVQELRMALRNFWTKGGMDDAKAEEFANQAIANMVGGGSSPPGTIIVPDPSSTRPRTLKVPDAVVEKYLDNNVERVLEAHYRDLGTDVAFREEFGGKGLSDELDEIDADYMRMYQDAIAKGDRKLAESLDKERRQAKIDLQSMYQRLFGVFGKPDNPQSSLVRFGRNLRAVTAGAYLGGVVLSSLPDLVRSVFQYGLRDFVRGYAQLVNFKRFGLTFQETQRLGEAADLALHSRALALMGEANERPLTRLEGAMIRGVGRITGLSHYMTAVKAMAGAISGHSLGRLARAAAAGTIDTVDMAKLRRAGISQDMAVRIGKQLDQFEDTDGALNIPRTSSWTDREAAMTMEGAIVNEINYTSLETGIGDTPLSWSSEMGKVLSQFQSFGVNVLNKMISGGMSRMDANYVTGIIMTVGMGAIVAAAKDAARGRDPTERAQKEPDKFLLDAISRSGVLGTWTLALDAARRLSGDTPSRYMGKSLTAQTYGPVLGGYFPSAVEVASETLRGEGDQDTLWRAARLVPFFNAFHLRDLLERAVRD